jgi:hypothetical protein
MKRPIIFGKIAKIHSYEDEGHIFEQYFYFEVRDKKILRIFDPSILIKNEMIDTIKKMTLSAFLPQIQKMPEQRFFINSDISINDKEQKPMHFEGKIEEFNESRNRFILNIGIGSIEVDIHPFQTEGFEPGDFVKFDVYRIDLNVLYPSN